MNSFVTGLSKNDAGSDVKVRPDSELRTIRKASNITQAQFGEGIGYTDRHIRRFENGKVRVPEFVLRAYRALASA